ncbi:LuxR C-terminal-related transcriptional regulator [Spirillospora sp. CA-294931]|uniref:ATP-binding protein n=1 Tax=Spirillospora sp. CA-294931 TaxID=3240042 RepID=UPI003D8D025B
MLYGRDDQRDQIARMITDARDHRRSGVLLLRGEAGIGKSALLDEAAAAPGLRVLRSVGVEAESDLAFAGLNQLLWPVRERSAALPGPQAEALRTALGVVPSGQSNGGPSRRPDGGPSGQANSGPFGQAGGDSAGRAGGGPSGRVEGGPSGHASGGTPEHAGRGTPGQAGDGTSGQTGDGSSGRSDGGSSGHVSGGTPGQTGGGAPGQADSGTSWRADGGTSGRADGGSSGHAGGGTPGHAARRPFGQADGGSSEHVSGGTPGQTGGGTPGQADSGSSWRADSGSAGRAGDRFTTGLAVLTLLADLADDGPVLCVVDDAQWLDTATSEALLFAARRLAAEGVVMLFATREDEFTGTGLPEMLLERLGRADAERLLAGAGVPAARRGRVIKEAAGNPLALIEFGASWQRLPSGAQPIPLADRVIASFRSRIGALPERTRLMLLLAAAEGRGHLPTLLGAAGSFGADLADLEPAERERLVQVNGTVLTFRHPLIRAAAYHGAVAARRIAAHAALAVAADDADCRARHLAAAATSPDESVAAELDQAAERARRRSGYATAASLVRQAADLTPDPSARARRLADAASAHIEAGNAAEAVELARWAGTLTADPAQHARLATLRAAVEFERGDAQTAARMVIEHVPSAARDDLPRMLRTAAVYGWSSGERTAVRHAAELLADAGHDDQAVRGLAALIEDDPARGLPLLSSVIDDVCDTTSPGDRATAVTAGLILGDDGRTLELAETEAARCRRNGLVGQLPSVLQSLAQVQIAVGRHQDAEATVGEAIALARDTGFERRVGRLEATLARVAAIEGDEERLGSLIELAPPPGGGNADTALSLLDLGLGRYDAALRRLDAIVQGPRGHSSGTVYATGDLVETAVRAGEPERALPALERFLAWAEAGGQPWARAVALRCRALVDDAEKPYVQALELHEQATRPFERARTELLYGEWLRRARRRSDARVPLKSAIAVFDRLRAAPWAERARAELRATGEPGTAQGQTLAPALIDRLTPQELQVVRLAADGISSREIAAQLFLSPRTVEYHLYKAYPKLGVSSRRELPRLRPDLEPATS